MTDQKSVGRRIKQLLNEKKMSQKGLSDRTGISVSAISTYVTGRRQPSVVALMKIAKVLNTTIDYLLTGGTPNKEDDMELLKILLRQHAGSLSYEEKRELILMIFDDFSV